MYIPKYFIIQEYVPRWVFEKWGDKAWMFIDERQLIADDRLREEFGRVVINNWHTGGNREWSGLRTSDSPYYSQFSQHTFGRASDKLFLDNNVDGVRNEIIANPDKYPFISAVEMNTTWLHTDCRNVEPIKQFYP